MTHSQRLDLIYEYKIHGTAIRKIARDYNQRYTTVRTILKSYEKDNRTNRKLNYWTKVTLLNKREGEINRYLQRQ